MYGQLTETVIQLADLSDPTSDGILTKLVTYFIGALMVAVAGIGSWKVFNKWKSSTGAGFAGLRDEVFGILIVEAILGAIIVLANYGTSLITQFWG